MASSKSSKGSGMNQAITPDKAETNGKSGMSGGKGGKKSMPMSGKKR